MIPPLGMLTKKKRAPYTCWLCLGIALIFVAGCSPSGPQSLSSGKQLLDKGQPGAAVRKLRAATSLMPTNALAWGYLGLAYHYSGSASNATVAYTRSIELDPEASETRFNLGSLWMEQGAWLQALEQFSLVTVLQPDFAPGWLRLGEAQIRTGNYAAASSSLTQSLQLNAGDADAWNWLGIAQLQQGMVGDASKSFQSALSIQANHGPALLNLAILAQQHLKDSKAALTLYRQYVAFMPNASNADDVSELITTLEQELAAQQNTVARTTKPVSETPPPSPNPAAKPSVSQSNAVVVATRTPEPEVPLQEPAPEVPDEDVPAKKATPNSRPPETVTVEPPPTIVAANNDPEPLVQEAASEGVPSEPAPVSEPSPESASQEETKRGFFAKINPANLFKKRGKNNEPTSLPETGESAVKEPNSPGGGGTGQNVSEPNPLMLGVEIPDPSRYPRYTYRLSAAPTIGNVEEGKRLFLEAEQLRKLGRRAEARQTYAASVRADPSQFAAQFSVGLLSLEEGNLPMALPAFEASTWIDTTSAAARYNFALALKSSNYPVDSANELVKLLTYNHDDANAYLTLGNLFARQFDDNLQAREYYLKVIELSPNNPQADAIRFWLAENPL